MARSSSKGKSKSNTASGGSSGPSTTMKAMVVGVGIISVLLIVAILYYMGVFGPKKPTSTPAADAVKGMLVNPIVTVAADVIHTVIKGSSSNSNVPGGTGPSVIDPSNTEGNEPEGNINNVEPNYPICRTFKMVGVEGKSGDVFVPKEEPVLAVGGVDAQGNPHTQDWYILTTQGKNPDQFYTDGITKYMICTKDASQDGLCMTNNGVANIWSDRENRSEKEIKMDRKSNVVNQENSQWTIKDGVICSNVSGCLHLAGGSKHVSRLHHGNLLVLHGPRDGYNQNHNNGRFSISNC